MKTLIIMTDRGRKPTVQGALRRFGHNAEPTRVGRKYRFTVESHDADHLKQVRDRVNMGGVSVNLSMN